MIAFNAIQTTLRTAIVATSIWTGEAVLVDDGKQLKAEADALRDRGQVAVIFPALSGETSSQGGGKAVVLAGMAIRVAINPAKAGAKNIFDLIAAVKTAVLGIVQNNPGSRPELASRAFVLDDSDPGELAYIIFFQVRCFF